MAEATHDTHHKPSGSPEKYLWLLAGGLLLGLIAAVAWKTWPLLFPQTTLTGLAQPGCDLNRGPCVAEFITGGRVELSFSPRPAPLLEPLQLEVRAEGIDAGRVDVDFSGVEMYMGYNRAELQPAGGQRFVGQAVLPVCVRDQMRWEAKVLLHTPDNLYAARFRFEARSR